MTSEVLVRCKCGDPMFPKVKASGTGEYLACHHCDRLCGSWGEAWSSALGRKVPHFFHTGIDLCPRCATLDNYGKEIP